MTIILACIARGIGLIMFGLEAGVVTGVMSVIDFKLQAKRATTAAAANGYKQNEHENKSPFSAYIRHI